MHKSKNVLVEFLVGMGLYTLLLIVMLRFLPFVHFLPGRILLAGLPLIGVLLVLRSVFQAIREMDELQKRIQLEAATFSMATTAFLTFTLGLLENVGFPPISLIWVLPMTAMFWGLGQAIANRRYK